MTPLASYRFLLRHCQKTISTSNSAGKNAAFVVCKFRRQTKQIKLVATLFTAKLGRKNCRLYIGSIWRRFCFAPTHKYWNPKTHEKTHANRFSCIVRWQDPFPVSRKPSSTTFSWWFSCPSSKYHVFSEFQYLDKHVRTVLISLLGQPAFSVLWDLVSNHSKIFDGVMCVNGLRPGQPVKVASKHVCALNLRGPQFIVFFSWLVFMWSFGLT